MVKFTECLNDTWDYFFLGDPERLMKFKHENQLADDLISEFTMNESGDLAAQKGVLIPMSGIVNLPYHIYFQIQTDESIFNKVICDLQFKKTGYILEVTHRTIYLMTLPYLKNWTAEGGIKSLKTNGIRPKIDVENGVYAVDILGGLTKQEGYWEPTIEFILRKKDDAAVFKVENLNQRFQINLLDDNG